MIELLTITFKDLLNPEFYIENGGLYLFLFIVFAETGLFAGFFLPGDSLLFVAGIYSNMLAAYLYDTGSDFWNVMMLIGLTTLAGVLGNFVGYWFGAKSGPYLFQRKDSFFFKKKYLFQAKEFYEKHGGGAIVFARFLPLIRTFAPIIAGIVGMNKRKFAFYNIIGCVAWAASMLLAGHYLEKLFRVQFGFDLKAHLELIVLGIVLVTTTPVLIKIFKKKKPEVNS
ncbi:MAG TPA: VTT domain-containing protein [Parasegetibacter sp.]